MGDFRRKRRPTRPLQQISRTNQGNVKAFGPGACETAPASSGTLSGSDRGKFEAHGQISPAFSQGPRAQQADRPLIAHDDIFLMEIIVSTISRAPAVAQVTAGSSWTALIWIKFKAWWTAHRMRQTELAAMQQLQLLSDRDLMDIGLGRSEIPYAVSHDVARERTFGRYF
jgi:uncharacterized protein YjiS (DUF1127 family)